MTTCPRHEHVSRRALLKGVVGTAAGGALMNWGSLFGSHALADQVKKEQKHCILIWLNGGASQFETFDMKVGRPTGGMFREIKTNLPGAHICELMPRIAKMMDKITVIRSMHTSQIDHPGGIHLMHTAYAEAANVRFPELGAVVAKYNGRPGADLPDFIKVSSNGNSGAGFLGPKYAPFNLNHEGKLPPFSTSNMDADREERRHGLRQFMESQFTGNRNLETTKMHAEGYEAARRLNKAYKAFDIEDEWVKNKDLYGDSNIGRGLLLARRLIEQGVAFVEVGQSGWDTHADNFVGHRGLVPPMEHAWAGLMQDLEQRGLFDKTLIVWMGEIGRTPNINNRAGRDHYVRAWSSALAGCGVKRGLVYGRSDEDGKDVAENPVTEGDFFATVYSALGINPGIEHYNGVRPIPIAPFKSKPVKEILA